jgi:hypothetical protein
VLIDCTKKSVKMTTPDGKEMEFVAQSVATAKGVANHVRMNQLDACQGPMEPVLNEFPDELPSLSPD